MCRLLFLCLLSGSTALAAIAARPNFVWIVSEDNNPWLGCYGEPLARTPVLDRLAATGVRYLHAHASAPVCAPSRAAIITGRAAPRLGTQHMRSNVVLPEGLSYFPATLRAAGYYCTNRAKTDYNAAVLPGTWDENGPQAHWRRRAPGQPFFAVFNFNSTHESNLHERRALQTDPARVRVPAYLPDTPEVRADIAQYHDCHAVMDRQVGAVLAELEAAGLADDTIVFYYADNGGVLPRSKRFLYDNGTRVPFIVRFGKNWAHLAPAAPGAVSDELVSLLDLPPTMLSLAGLPVPPDHDGRALAGSSRAAAPGFIHAHRDRMDEIYDFSRAVIGPRYRYIRNYHPERPAGLRLDYAWRLASMRAWERLHRAGGLDSVQESFFRPRAPEELFDVTTDPDCVRNLAGDPAHRAVLGQMRAANRARLLATRDLGFLPEAMLRAFAGAASPALLGADESRYPLAQLIELVDRLQLDEPPAPETLRAALTSPLAIVRYWGATCAGRVPDLTPALTDLLTDADPSVRLAAAGSLLRQGAAPEAWETVAASLGADRPPEERLAAMNLVTQVHDFPTFIRHKLQMEPPPESPFFGNFYLHQVKQALGASSLGTATAPP